MKTLSAALRLEKNRMATPNAWLATLDITLPGDERIFLVRNNENITFQGNEYTAINFEIEPPEEGSTGGIPSMALRVSNVSRSLQAYMERYTGGLGSTVLLRVINSDLVEEDYADLEMEFGVLECNCDAMFVNFKLGAASPLRQRFPSSRYIAHFCAWQYKSVECAYAGDLPACARTLSDCETHGNAQRFGGYPGMSGAFHVV